MTLPISGRTKGPDSLYQREWSHPIVQDRLPQNIPRAGLSVALTAPAMKGMLGARVLAGLLVDSDRSSCVAACWSTAAVF